MLSFSLSALQIKKTPVSLAMTWHYFLTCDTFQQQMKTSMGVSLLKEQNWRKLLELHFYLLLLCSIQSWPTTMVLWKKSSPSCCASPCIMQVRSCSLQYSIYPPHVLLAVSEITYQNDQILEHTHYFQRFPKF